MLTDKETIQKTLDFLKSEFEKNGRIGAHFDIKDLPFVKHFGTGEQLMPKMIILRLQLEDSELFCQVGPRGGEDHFRLTKTGRLVKDRFNWDYGKYQRSHKEHLFWRIVTRAGALLAVFLAGLQIYQSVTAVDAVDKSNNTEQIDKTQDSLIQVLFRQKDSL